MYIGDKTNIPKYNRGKCIILKIDNRTLLNQHHETLNNNTNNNNTNNNKHCFLESAAYLCRSRMNAL